MHKISGPLLDRIDIHIEVPAVDVGELARFQPGTTSQQMRQRVEQARLRQQRRFRDSTVRFNAQMSSRDLRHYCTLGDESRRLLTRTVDRFGLSARAHDKVLRVARTIADLEDVDDIECEHIQEAVNYRMLDRQYWS